MSHPYHIDERDMMFNLKECPGLGELTKLEAFEDLDEETAEMIFEQSKQFSQKVAAPILAESDRFGSVLKDGKVLLPDSVGDAWEQYKELGLIGMCSDSTYGGADLPHLVSTPVAEMECGSFVAFSMLPLLTRGAARLIWAFGTDALKDTYLENMFTGEWTGTMCLTEPSAGSDVGAGVTKAVPDGDAYKITGTKIFISWGEHELSNNIIHLVLARTPDAPAGSKGLSLFVVPKYKVNADGSVGGENNVVCSNIEHKMGIKASPTCVINFENSVGYLVGGHNQGMSHMFQMMNEARIEVGVQGMAIASAAYLSSLEYAKERVQGVSITSDGPKPAKIIEHPDVRRMLLKMRALVEGSRALINHLMYYFDMSHHHPTDKEKYNALVELMVPICKSYGSDQGFRVTEMAVQVYGGYGYCQEYPAEQYLRDCKISSIYEGTNGIQALDLVMRKLLKNKGAFFQVWVEDVKDICGQAATTEVADLIPVMDQATRAVGETVQAFGAMMMGGKQDVVLFNATDFQEAYGHIMVGYFLLRQAVTAANALKGDVTDGDRNYYEQKIVTTRYFFETLVPNALHALETMRADKATGLTAQFA